MQPEQGCKISQVMQMAGHGGRLERMLKGMALKAGATREAPAQAELRPTCAGVLASILLAPEF